MSHRSFKHNGYFISVYDELVSQSNEEIIAMFDYALARKRGSESEKELNSSAQVSNLSSVIPAPEKAVGQIETFFKGGVSIRGTAQFCCDNFMLLTAAHCVYDALIGDVEKIVFKRCVTPGGYEQQVNVMMSCVPCEYIELGQEYCHKAARDYALCLTAVASTVGCLSWCNFHEELPADKTALDVVALGYPIDTSNGTNSTVQVNTIVSKEGCASDGTDYEKFDNYEEKGAETLQMNNDFVSGASGGAWYIKESHKVVSLNSQSPTWNDKVELGPVFGDGFLGILNSMICYKECLKNVQSIKLENRGVYVAEIVILWKNSVESSFKSKHFDNDILYHKSFTVNLGDLGGIEEGAIVKMRVHVVSRSEDEDVEYPEEFVYNSSCGQTVEFRCTDTVWNAKVYKLGYS